MARNQSADFSTVANVMEDSKLQNIVYTPQSAKTYILLHQPPRP